VRRAALLHEPAVVPDGQLLESFLKHRDEIAFTQLVKRHGPMVLGVCARIIGNVHDAEDAFQAVFLVLARRAGSIVPRDMVGNWLYGVAYRTALQARGQLARRQTRERQVTEMPHPTVAAEVDFDALHQALDTELDRLPEKYRVPVVLCDLEGRSRKDVAGQLKIPEGTLSSRLATARTLLARRLTRHGIVLSGPALAVALTQPAVAVQPTLVAIAVKAAVVTAAGESAAGLVSTKTLSLSEGVLKTMFLKKLKVLSVLALGVVLGGLGTSLFGMSEPAMTPTAHAAQPTSGKPPGERVVETAGDPEPLDGKLLLEPAIQEELRLSKNQIDRLQVLSLAVDARNGAKQKEIKDLERQIAELRERIAKLEQDIDTKRTQIEKQRSQSLGAAAPDILSEQAVKRLRHLQRQQRDLFELLADTKIQRMLKIDDEQLKKIDAILKAEHPTIRYPLKPHNFGLWSNTVDIGDSITYGLRLQGLTEVATLYTKDNIVTTIDYYVVWNTPALQKLFDVLTPVQQQALLDWIGEPKPGSSWDRLKRAVEQR
jgi:RNA polymerase sigma factor (sigma-70 family)